MTPQYWARWIAFGVCFVALLIGAGKVFWINPILTALNALRAR